MNYYTVNSSMMKAIAFAVLAFFITLISFSFFAQADSGPTANADSGNFKTLKSLKSAVEISDEGTAFIVTKRAKKKFEMNSSDSLVVGYPLELVGESYVFGATVIRVSDPTDENLGMLKTASITGLIRTEIADTKSGGEFLLRGAMGTHLENTPLDMTLTIPMSRNATEPKFVFLDFSTLGEKLDIGAQLVKNEHWSAYVFQDLKHVASQVVSVDFSLKTLVFDIDSKYKVIEKKDDVVISEKEVTVTTRWFMRLSSFASPFFVPRPNVEGVGFFAVNETDKSAPITRFGISDLQRKPIKYYLKNVPKIWENAFVSALFDWNHKLQGTIGYDLLSYEILEKNDPRYDQIVTGDVRFNVIEWDLDNRAPYGGLGPNIAHPTTGEVLSAQTLIQGPAVEELYTDWFGVNNPNSSSIQKNQTRFEYKVSFAKTANFNIPAQDPRLFDSKTEGTQGMKSDSKVGAKFRMDFVPTPNGFSYESYMNGYFREMVSHEVGHNLGLRHNFKGSLADNDTGTVGSVSWSVMEYAPRTQRHLNRVGSYDVMAIAYGYLGITPKKLDMYCSDEDDGFDKQTNSPECSTADATSDGYGFLLSRMNRGIDLLLNRGVDAAPLWSADDLGQYLPNFIKSIAQYGLNAEKTSSTWLNFFKVEKRPKLISEILPFVGADLNQLICDAGLDSVVQSKSKQEDKDLALSNLVAYRKAMFESLKDVSGSEALLNKSVLSCFE